MNNFVVKVTNVKELKMLEAEEPMIKELLSCYKNSMKAFPMLFTFDSNGNISYHTADKEKFLADSGYLIVRLEV